jgi:hypothetical protein
VRRGKAGLNCTDQNCSCGLVPQGTLPHLYMANVKNKNGINPSVRIVLNLFLSIKLFFRNGTITLII